MPAAADVFDVRASGCDVCAIWPGHCPLSGRKDPKRTLGVGLQPVRDRRKRFPLLNRRWAACAPALAMDTAGGGWLSRQCTRRCSACAAGVLTPRRALANFRLMAVVLITGNPGSGKTELARELSRLGWAALDADEIAHYETTEGLPAYPPEELTYDWLQAHRWVWGRAQVMAAIAEPLPDEGHVFLCGIAMDQEELLDLVDVVFLLSIDERTQVRRLDAPSNDDRNADQRRQIIEGRPAFEQRMRACGAVVLDGRDPTPALAARIVQEVRQRFPADR